MCEKDDPVADNRVHHYVSREADTTACGADVSIVSWATLPQNVTCRFCIRLMKDKFDRPRNMCEPEPGVPALHAYTPELVLVTWDNVIWFLKAFPKMVPSIVAKGLVFGDDHELETWVATDTAAFYWRGGV